ncbi:MAG TPA: dipeptide epimerase [Caulobacteraceae bacterium]|nr:dipeptide epimerase [Caulobacteraceae bacterium]
MRLTIEEVRTETRALPLEEARRIARETSAVAEALQVTVSGAGREGRGEASPTARWGESLEGLSAQAETAVPALVAEPSRRALQRLMPAGAARNAVDAALWDLEAKQGRRSAEVIAGLAPTHPVTTAYTIPIKPPVEAAEVARRERGRPLIKVKLGDFPEDRARLKAIRQAAPDATLIVDANEGWSLDQLKAMAPVARDLGVRLIEQPLRAGADGALEGVDFGVPLCADESCHTRADIPALAGRYQFINIKLDKAGGLTEALAMVEAATALGLGLMVGSTHGTTLGMAPAFLVGQSCVFCDLDAPLFLAQREEEELAYDGSRLDWSRSRRWGLA